MTEEGTAVVTEPAVAPEPTVTYFGSDGVLNEGWQGTLEDESLREEASLSTFKTVGDLAKSFVNTKSMVGKNTMVVPTDASSELEWQEYYKAGGRPETVEDYNLKAPDDFPEEVLEQIFPKERMAEWQKRFFEGGVSKKTADKYIAYFAADMIIDIQAAEQEKTRQLEELTNGLSTDWGAAYDQKLHRGNVAIEEGTGGDAEFKTRVVAKVQHDPDLTRLLANLGDKFAEGKSPNYQNIPTPADYKTQIAEIEANPLYLNGTQPERMKLAEQVMALRTKIHETKTT